MACVRGFKFKEYNTLWVWHNILLLWLVLFITFVQSTLPEGYNHIIEDYKEVSQGKFEAKLRFKVDSQSDMQKWFQGWLDAYQKMTCSQWRVKTSYPGQVKRTSYRVTTRIYRGRVQHYFCNYFKGGGAPLIFFRASFWVFGIFGNYMKKEKFWCRLEQNWVTGGLAARVFAQTPKMDPKFKNGRFWGFFENF